MKQLWTKRSEEVLTSIPYEKLSIYIKQILKSLRPSQKKGHDNSITSYNSVSSRIQNQTRRTQILNLF